jgi:hypothetical protein
MVFDPRKAEARLALQLLPTSDMPVLAADALEAGLDGPAIRRMAALDSPTFFEIQAVLTQAMREMHLFRLEKEEAAVRLAKLRAQEILADNSDPLKHLREFESLWVAADYCHALQDYGTLDDELNVAKYMGRSEEDFRALVVAKLKKLAET